MIKVYTISKKGIVLLSQEIINNKHIPLCTDVEKVLTIMPEKNKIDIVKFRDYHMQAMQPFMIIADFDTYTNKLNQIKPNPYSNPEVYKSNAEKAVCLTCNNPNLTNNPHTYQYYCKKSRIFIWIQTW